jgi:chromosome segregation ATPase
MIATTFYRQLARLALALGLLLLLAAPVLAQDGQFICQDMTDRLNCTRIQTAAQPLLGRGAAVAVYMVDRGDSSGDDFLARLQADRLATGDLIDADLIAIYVSIEPRYAELRGGDRWNAALLSNNNITTIRTTKLVPSLAAGEFTAAYVDTLQAIDAAIANPPQPATSVSPATAPNSAPIDYTPLALSVLGVAALGGGGYAALRWRKARHALAEARWYCTQAKQAAGAAIVELDRALQADRDKAEYDQLSYGAADAELLAKTQREIAGQFEQVQARFDDSGERLDQAAKPLVADYEAASASYRQAQEQAGALSAQLAANQQRRQELDLLAQQAPVQIEQARSRLADAMQLLDPLADALADRDAVLAALRERVAQAEAALAEHDARRAIELAQATQELLNSLSSTVHSYGDLQARIQQLRHEAAVLEAQGYRMTASHDALDTAQTALENAVSALQRDGSSAASALLGEAGPALEQAIAQGRGLIALRAENEQRSLALGVQARQVAALIETARKTFDLVDEFAESTWNDIRGNGSEAEASAAEAATLWQRAVARNNLETQEFAAAREELNALEAQLARAASLSEAIIQRLKDLEHARAIAKEELAAAAADVAAGNSYLAAHDPDIGKQPEEQLRKAADLLAQTEAEAAKPKPDWLTLVRLAQAANAEADAALTGARSEVETMDKLRAQVQHAQQLAASEVQRAKRFYETHRSDLSWSISDSLHDLQEQLQLAHDALRQAESLAEEQRRDALEHARGQFVNVDGRADKVYAKLYAAFQEVEAARQAEEAARRSSSSSSWSSSGSSWSSSGSGSSSSSSSSSRGSSSGGSWGGGSRSGGSWGGGSRSGGGW